MKNTGVMCMVHVGDRDIDMGDYFTDEKGEKGEKFLITSRELAEKYGHLVDCPIYVFRAPKALKDGQLKKVTI